MSRIATRETAASRPTANIFCGRAANSIARAFSPSFAGTAYAISRTSAKKRAILAVNRGAKKTIYSFSPSNATAAGLCASGGCISKRAGHSYAVRGIDAARPASTVLQSRGIRRAYGATFSGDAA